MTWIWAAEIFKPSPSKAHQRRRAADSSGAVDPDTRTKQWAGSGRGNVYPREKPPAPVASRWNFLGYARRSLTCAEARATVAGEEPQGAFALGSLESTAAVRIPPCWRLNQKHTKVDWI